MARTRKRRLRRVGGLTAVVTSVVLSAVTLPAHAAPEGKILGAGLPGSVGGSYLVTLKEDTAAASKAGRGLLGSYGATVNRTYDTALNGFAVEADERQARRLAADPRVASVVQDTRVTLDAAGVAKNPPSWGLDRVDQPGRPLDNSYNWPKSAGAGVTVYVIDTGIRITHTDFGGRASHGWDFVGGDRVAADGNGHGTHVAGTVAGTRLGVAKKARVVAVRVLDNAGAGTTAQAIAGIDWVTRHARRPRSPISAWVAATTRRWTRPSAPPSGPVSPTPSPRATWDSRPPCTPRPTCGRPSRSAPPTGGRQGGLLQLRFGSGPVRAGSVGHLRLVRERHRPGDPLRYLDGGAARGGGGRAPSRRPSESHARAGGAGAGRGVGERQGFRPGARFAEQNPPGSTVHLTGRRDPLRSPRTGPVLCVDKRTGS